MILNIRGTSGSGKTSLVKKVMEKYELKKRVYKQGRKSPIGYVLKRSDGPPGEKPVFVLGSYENVCGGCDTIRTFDEIFKAIKSYHERGYNVIFEGLLLSTVFKGTHQLHADGWPIIVIGLNLSADECIDSVNARRKEKDPDAKPVEEKGTRDKHKVCERNLGKFEDKGMKVYRVNREEAFNVILEKLGL